MYEIPEEILDATERLGITVAAHFIKHCIKFGREFNDVSVADKIAIVEVASEYVALSAQKLKADITKHGPTWPVMEEAAA